MNLTVSKELEITNFLSEFEKKYVKRVNGKIEYTNKNDFNIFNLLNLCEDSHTELIVWLLKTTEKNSAKIAQVKTIFQKWFFNYIFPDSHVNFECCEDLEVKFQYPFLNRQNIENYIDIIVFSKQNNFVGIIENKLDGDISINSYDKTTQLERYRQFVCDDFKYENEEQLPKRVNHFVFLCPDEELLSTKNKSGRYSEVKIDEQIHSFKYDQDIIDKLNENRNYPKYKTIDYSDVVKILYAAIEEADISLTNSETKEILLDYLLKDNSENAKKVKEFLLQLSDTDINSLKTNTDLKARRYIQPEKYNISLFNILSEITSDDVLLKILSQYITYWENSAEFNGGYTKLVKDFDNYNDFMFNICKNIKINYKDIYENLSSNLKDIVDDMCPDKAIQH